MIKKIKGQGALEYLLLIGGAVLIAVIVIALLIGMGGQSRETAQDQATKSQRTLDQPQPATIVSIIPLTTTTTPAAAANCASGADGEISVNWQKLGSGGDYNIVIYDFQNTALSVGLAASPTFNSLSITTATNPVHIFVTIPAGNNCADTYWAEITTTKNGQTVKSTRMKFNWQ